MIPLFTRPFLPLVVFGLCGTLLSPTVYGYELENGSWPGGSVITMQMELGPLSQTLQDGSPSWNEAAGPAIDVLIEGPPASEVEIPYAEIGPVGDLQCVD